MSDERDGSDAAADGSEAEGGRTAVVTRPQRPSGKRSRQRAADTTTGVEGADLADGAEGADGVDGADAETAPAKTKKKTTQTAKTKKARRVKKTTIGAELAGPFVYIYNYLKQVVAELRKVIWPNRKQMITYTSVVLAFLVFMVALIGGADFGFAKLIMLVFGESAN